MAANMKAVKLRIKSVQSTMQITKAMELVASSKLRRAKERAENSRPYFEKLYSTLTDIAQGNTDFTHPYAKGNAVTKTCYVLLAGDRGLAGGYNANVFKKFEEIRKGAECVVLPIGKKALEYAKRKELPCLTESFAELADIKVSGCFDIATTLCKAYKAGEIGHIELVYTKFISMLTQRPEAAMMLPLKDLAKNNESASDEKEPGKPRELILYEPSAEVVFERIVPEYLAGVIYGAICEAAASELAARRTAMESATGNAEEMLENLNLYYNRARQAGITQEITEIVGGAESI